MEQTGRINRPVPYPSHQVPVGLPAVVLMVCTLESAVAAVNYCRLPGPGVMVINHLYGIRMNDCKCFPWSDTWIGLLVFVAFGGRLRINYASILLLVIRTTPAPMTRIAPTT